MSASSYPDLWVIQSHTLRICICCASPLTRPRDTAVSLCLLIFPSTSVRKHACTCRCKPKQMPHDLTAPNCPIAFQAKTFNDWGDGGLQLGASRKGREPLPLFLPHSAEPSSIPIVGEHFVTVLHTHYMCILEHVFYISIFFIWCKINSRSKTLSHQRLINQNHESFFKQLSGTF